MKVCLGAESPYKRFIGMLAFLTFESSSPSFPSLEKIAFIFSCDIASCCNCVASELRLYVNGRHGDANLRG